MSNAVVIGASTGVGKALARALATRGVKLVIVSRDERDIAAVAADVRERHAVECMGLARDIADLGFDVDAFVDAASAFAGPIDAVYIPAGCVRDDDSGPNPDVLVPLTAANYLGPARLAAAFGRRMQGRGSGEIVLFSSIAAAAPRTRNAAYSASKAALELYARALRQALEPRGICVRVYALGYVDTALSYGMKLRLPIAAPEAIAETIVLESGQPGLRYLPRWWALIVLILRYLPWFLYRRLSF